MVKITGPLMSESASGKIGERLVFSKRASGQQARFQKAQKDIISLPRSSNRFLYFFAGVVWSTFSLFVKNSYDLLALKESMTGYNYFVKFALLYPLQYLGLAGYWSFNETTGATVFDNSKNLHTGLLKPTYPSNVPVRLASFSSKLGNALLFNGNAKLVSISNPILSPSFMTLSCLVKRSSFAGSTYKTIFSTSSTNIHFMIFNLSWNALLWDGTGRYSTYFLPNDNKYHHIVYVITSSTRYSLYVDGVFHSNVSTSLNLSNHSVGIIGNWSSGNYWVGYLDEPMVFNRALSAFEIKKLYNYLMFK